MNKCDNCVFQVGEFCIVSGKFTWNMRRCKIFRPGDSILERLERLERRIK